MGLYGAADASGQDPDYMLVMIQVNEQVSSSVLSGMTDQLGFPSTPTQTSDGVDFYCATSSTDGGATVCLWIDGNVLGVVVGDPTMGAAATLAAAEDARSAGETPS